MTTDSEKKTLQLEIGTAFTPENRERLDDAIEKLKKLRFEMDYQAFMTQVGQIFDAWPGLNSFVLECETTEEWDSSDGAYESFALKVKQIHCESEDAEHMTDIADDLRDAAGEVYNSADRDEDRITGVYSIHAQSILPYSGRARALAAKALLEGISNACLTRKLKP